MMKTLMTSLCALAFSLTLAFPVAAQEQGELSSALRGLKWSSPELEVTNWFKRLKDDEFKKESGKLADPVLKEELRRLKNSELEAIKGTFKKLSGDRTGYEVSVITGEFHKNNGESLMVDRDSVSQRYFLFTGGRLWKLVVAYNTEYIQDIGFEAFVDQVSRKYGDPDETFFDEEGGGNDLARAVWRDEATELRIENKTDFFNTFTMVFSDRTVADRMANIQKSFDKETRLDGSVSVDIADIQEDDSFAVNEDIVDSLTGSRTDVDIDSGMREDRALKRVDFEEKSAEADNALPAESAKKRKRAKRAKRKKPAAKKKKSKDLIIY